jgi:radical SAM superfamily enzyme YgiQ (UPF0313 family)
MKILFIAPLYKASHIIEFIENFKGIPLTQLRLASLTPNEFEVQIIDENVGDKLKFEDIDLVCISFLMYFRKRAYEIADIYRNKGIQVIMGGIHTSLFPEEALKHADSVVVGEVDDEWGNILKDFKDGKLKKEYVISKKPEISKLPLMDRSLVNSSKYDLSGLVITGRGCPTGCDFCTTSMHHGKIPRSQDIETIVQEIRNIKKNSKRFMDKIVIFMDDNIVRNVTYAKELFKAITPLKIKWVSQSSINIAKDDELLDLAYKSGCRMLFIGFESINQNSLNDIHKHFKADEYKELIAKLKNKGIFILGSFVFGFDYDNKSVFRETLRFIEGNYIDFINSHILIPNPKTALYNRLDKEGRLLTKQWELYQENVVFKPKNMSIEELKRGHVYVYKKFYSLQAILTRVFRSLFKHKLATTFYLLIVNLTFWGKMKKCIRRAELVLERKR